MSTERRDSVDIAIVGGGMVGASLALLLSALNPKWRIRVIEAVALEQSGQAAQPVPVQPSFDARSTALSQSSREIFEQLGLWADLAPGLAAISQIHVSDRGHMGTARLHAAEQRLPALGYVVENRWLGSVLMQALQRAPNVALLAPASVVAVVPRRDGVLLSLETSGAAEGGDGFSPFLARLLVVADGAQSRTRDLLGISASSKDYGQVAIIANLSLQQDHGGVAYERFTDLGPMALLPLLPLDGEHRAALIWTLPPERAAAMLAADDAAFLAELQQRFGHRLGHFQRVGSRHSYPIRLITSDEQVRRHVVVAGNAAHSLHPVAGQGFNLALRDLAVLAEVLGETVAGDEAIGDLPVLQRYLQRQQADQQQTILLSDLLPRVFGLDAAPVALARNMGLLALDAVPLLRQQFARLGMGLETRGTDLQRGVAND
ncbi:2-octaprenyl-6-methoxyphenyl hydroxylase [Porticoccus sp.]